MKKFSIILCSLVMGSVVMFTSCKKDDDDDDDTVPTADIQISAPVAGHEYMFGDTVFVNSTITGSAALHGWDIFLRNSADQTVLYTTELHDHAATYTIAQQWVNSVTAHTTVELEVVATLDHDGHTASKKVTFMCHPM